MLSSKNHNQNIKSWLIRNVHRFIETNNMDEVEPESSRKSITNKIHNIANSYIIKLRKCITSMKKQKLSKHMFDTLKYSKIVQERPKTVLFYNLLESSFCCWMYKFH